MIYASRPFDRYDPQNFRAAVDDLYSQPTSGSPPPYSQQSYAHVSVSASSSGAPGNPCNTNCLAFLAAAATIGLIVVNILALYGYLNTQTLSIVNTSTLGVASFVSFVALCKAEKFGKPWKRLALLTAGVVLIACAGLASLGIFKVFNTTSVTWTVFAPVIAASGLALTISLIMAVGNHNDERRWLAGTAIGVLTIALFALNIVAMNGQLNAQTIGIINTTIFGSIALVALPAIFSDMDEKRKAACLAIFLILGTMASLSALGISGDFTAKSVGWTLFVPIITAASIGVLAGLCACTGANKCL